MVLPEFQRRGVAREAARRLLERVAAEGRWPLVHARCSATSAPSNAICRALGFERLGQQDIEFAGRPLRAWHWRLDLRLAALRARYAGEVMERAGVHDERLREALARVPRHAFCGPPPWRFDEEGREVSSDPAALYRDVALGLAPQRGITTGLPALHARCIAACAPAKGERVVQVGAGGGYYTAILAELVGSAGSVTAFEIDAELADLAAANLAPWPQVRVEARSGAGPIPAADVVYVCAGVQRIPASWLDALGPGGRLVVPLVPGVEPGAVWLVTRRAQALAATFLGPARFVPCVEATDEPAARELAAAYRRGGMERVRSLQRGSDRDAGAWWRGPGFSLSERDPGG
jgi:protein-L-isoaspartate(D-aspartate) O-methyltransferase